MAENGYSGPLGQSLDRFRRLNLGADTAGGDPKQVFNTRGFAVPGGFGTPGHSIVTPSGSFSSEVKTPTELVGAPISVSSLDATQEFLQQLISAGFNPKVLNTSRTDLFDVFKGFKGPGEQRSGRTQNIPGKEQRKEFFEDVQSIGSVRRNVKTGAQTAPFSSTFAGGYQPSATFYGNDLLEMAKNFSASSIEGLAGKIEGAIESLGTKKRGKS